MHVHYSTIAGVICFIHFQKQQETEMEEFLLETIDSNLVSAEHLSSNSPAPSTDWAMYKQKTVHYYFVLLQISHFKSKSCIIDFYFIDS